MQWVPAKRLIRHNFSNKVGFMKTVAINYVYNSRVLAAPISSMYSEDSGQPGHGSYEPSHFGVNIQDCSERLSSMQCLHWTGH